VQVAELQWVAGLLRRLSGPLEALLDGSSVEEECVLGRWYRGNGRQSFGSLPGYARIGLAHEALHTAARRLLLVRTHGPATEIEPCIADVIREKNRLAAEISALPVSQSALEAAATASDDPAAGLSN